MRVLFVAILFFAANYLFAQEINKQDSLLSVAQADNEPLQQRVNAYIQLFKNTKNTQAWRVMQYADEAINLVKEQPGYQKEFIELLLYKGEAEITAGERVNGLQDYMKALEIAEKVNEPQLLATVYNNIARFYRERKPERAIPYYDQAMAIYEKLDDDEGRAVILNESGVAYEYKKDFEEAIRRYSTSLAIQYRRKDEVGIGYSLEFLAGAYLKKEEVYKAEKYILNALASRKKTKDSFALSINYSNIGSVYTAMKKWDKAIAGFDTSNLLASRIAYSNLLSHNFKELSGIYRQQGNYRKAFEAMEQHNLYKDSIFNIETEKNIEELHARYETEKNKRLLQEKDFAIDKRNYWITGMVFVVWVCIALAYIFYKRNQQKQEAKLQAAVLEQQEQATKAIIETEEKERQRIAIDLHDGVGQMMSAVRINLSSLESDLAFRDYATQKRFMDVLVMVDDSCKELRTVSHNMIPNGLLKNSLAAAIRSFLNKISSKTIEINLYTSGLDKRLNLDIETVLYRVIQECVNNVIKHAHANRLDISILKEDYDITATIEDNGVGFDARKVLSYQGIGLKNILSRINYLKGTVDFDTAPGRGTVIIITVPLV